MHHEIVSKKFISARTIFLMLLMLLGAAAFIIRFAFGLGATTNLSNNYPWGLWIVFDLVWIALAGGAFATAGIVYIFMAEKFHPLGRPAVWMGLISYNLVVVTLLADLGLPWHFWQLGVQRPEHSAMYEVSWCIALYVTVLALEFAPTIFERLDWKWLHNKKGFRDLSTIPFHELWRTLSPFYTVVALGLFVFLMGHSFWLALVAILAFAVVVILTLDSTKRAGVPVILVIAAVTFSTMHQSSLGSLFLLMPDKLNHLWWSPIMSILFFISAVASGIALVLMMDMLISHFFNRPYNRDMLASFGKVLWGVLIFYYLVRIIDVAARGELGLISGEKGGLFLLEVIAGGILPILLLWSEKVRKNRSLLAIGAILALFGVIFNRLCVVLLGMKLPGTMLAGGVGTYYPSIVEWAISISLIAAAVLFFSLGIKVLPILPAVSHHEGEVEESRETSAHWGKASGSALTS